ncbi:MAG: glycosyltransferase [Gammaproteobacteria bacterium]|uniref:Glycosyl transferase group 1 n=1 Tax=endosymbiont of Bathymodiolus septemdierum str. Myojin knoll TaxID=1303921 RepID=A0A0P0URG4_9GAMM|nr:glycosyltransferase [Bathymodiolus septemdierum thioautotrophic gill symbiont]RUA05755.1 MAG: glycosyltransferase [Gammaproteobacteria bacterium]BAS67696.1 glycosyl transferase group 1 [endosymbiont of Bathymodiolus septemdierum str. Myojin knoll]
MNVLMVTNTYCESTAAYRLHKELHNQGVNVKLLTLKKSNDDWTVISPSSRIEKFINILRSYADQIPVKLYKYKSQTLFSPSWFGFSNIVHKINKINPDIVHLHWINGGMMRIEDIAKIKAPIVWSLHDNWAFTGGCHIMWECERYKNNCGSCPRLGSNKDNDLSRKVFNRKQKVFSQKKDITIVGLSHWLNECSKNSALLKDKPHINLPNPIDINVFKPFDTNTSRELWNLPKDKKLVLFGANSATSDINKGFKELSEALRQLQGKNIEFVVFGSSEPKNPQDFGFKTHYLGYLHDSVSLTTLYSAADVMVVPSLQEAFGQTAFEAMACGTPVVCFNATGLKDIVDHKKNGYLAKTFDTTDLKNGIEWVLNHDNYDELCKNAREKIVKKFDSKIVAEKYIELYKELLND